MNACDSYNQRSLFVVSSSHTCATFNHLAIPSRKIACLPFRISFSGAISRCATRTFTFLRLCRRRRRHAMKKLEFPNVNPKCLLGNPKVKCKQSSSGSSYNNKKLLLLQQRVYEVKRCYTP